MGILSGMDIERVQSDININLYIQDVIANGINGYVLPDDELFKKVFSKPEVYASSAVMNIVGKSASALSANSKLLLEQKIKEFVDVWSNKGLSWYALQIFCGLGKSLYDVRDRINIEWAKGSAASAGCFSQYPLFLYLCGVISKTQWLRSRQGFVGTNPDTIDMAIANKFYLWDDYGVSSSAYYTLVDKVGDGDSVSEITLLLNNTLISGPAPVDAGTGALAWGAGSVIRQKSNDYFNTMTNENLKKIMVSKNREYLYASGSSFYYKVDTEGTKLYQPSAKEIGAGLPEVPANSPTTNQKLFQAFTASSAAQNDRILRAGSTAKSYYTRDTCVSSSVPRRITIDTSGAQVSVVLTDTTTLYIPVAFDLSLPEWVL